MDDHLKNRGFVPGPGSHNPDVSRYKITLGARTSYK